MYAIRNVSLPSLMVTHLCSVLAPRDQGDTDEVRRAKGFIRDKFKVIISTRMSVEILSGICILFKYMKPAFLIQYWIRVSGYLHCKDATINNACLNFDWQP